jgi:predicted GH43/DUF377 family glycosyl hydrolase
MIKLERLSDTPVVVPDPAQPWERSATFNTAAIYDNGLFHLLYRATDIGCHVRFGDYMNAIGSCGAPRTAASSKSATPST